MIMEYPLAPLTGDHDTLSEVAPKTAEALLLISGAGNRGTGVVSKSVAPCVMGVVSEPVVKGVVSEPVVPCVSVVSEPVVKGVVSEPCVGVVPESVVTYMRRKRDAQSSCCVTPQKGTCLK
jgi:hypothetical protein